MISTPPSTFPFDSSCKINPVSLKSNVDGHLHTIISISPFTRVTGTDIDDGVTNSILPCNDQFACILFIEFIMFSFCITTRTVIIRLSYCEIVFKKVLEGTQRFTVYLDTGIFIPVVVISVIVPIHDIERIIECIFGNTHIRVACRVDCGVIITTRPRSLHGKEYQQCREAGAQCPPDTSRRRACRGAPPVK